MTTNASSSRKRAAALALAAMLAIPAAQAATITVTTVDDAIPPATDGECSLREALANASDAAATYPDCAAGTGNDKITFVSALFQPISQYTATIHLSGMLEVGKDTGTKHALQLQIRPPSSTGVARRVRLVASTTSPHRVMHVRAAVATFELERISIEGGGQTSGNGAGILLACNDAIFRDVSFIGNQTATGVGGGLYQADGEGVLQIYGVRFEGNTALTGGAISLNNVRAHFVTIQGSQFVDNNAWAGRGGAIAFRVQPGLSPEAQPPKLNISGSIFDDNHASIEGGAIYITSGEDGANQAFIANINNNRFSANDANNGGALSVRGTPHNTLSTLILDRNSFIANEAENGGALRTADLRLTLANNLFSGNAAEVRGGALYHLLSSETHQIEGEMRGNTFHQQHLTGSDPLRNGRTLWLQIDSTQSPMWFMLGNLFAPAIDLPPDLEECVRAGSTLVPTGWHNLSPDAACLWHDPGNDILADPMVVASASGHALHPLAVMPQPGSAAIDGWPTGACTSHMDLLGNPRPLDGDGDGEAHCDIGAFELPAVVTDLIFANGFD